jgi:hypothetical protein
VNGGGCEFLAGSCFALDENGRVVRRHRPEAIHRPQEEWSAAQQREWVSFFRSAARGGRSSRRHRY